MMAQLKQLNFDFEGTGFKFELMDINWIVDPNGAKDNDTANMRRRLRKGGYDTLNLYFQDAHEGGYCYYPGRVSRGSQAFYNDGCYVSRLTVPGGSSRIVGEGKVASHEVGHWMSLYHPFDSGCSVQNDGVDDTPAEAQKRGASGCPEGTDTCPSLPGLDPIHNHMTYTADTCRTEFTPNQITRMKRAWAAYRQGN